MRPPSEVADLAGGGEDPDAGGLGLLEHAGAFFDGGSGGHDIVKEQERCAFDGLGVRGDEGAVNVLAPLGCFEADLGGDVALAHE